MDEKILQDRYRRLMESRSTGMPSSVPLETIEALAEDRLQGQARLEALESVLADPAARREYEFLREIARERPGVRSRSVAWRAAAAVLVVVGGGLIWRVATPAREDPLRGDGSSVVLLSPAAGATVAPGDTLVWSSVPGADRYAVEVVTAAGELAFSTETGDTIAVVVAGPAWESGTGQWWVTPSGGPSSGRRSKPAAVLLAPRS